MEYRNKIFNLDCIVGLSSIPDNSVDLVITDPPFAIDFKAQRGNYNRTGGRVLEGYKEILASEYLDFSRSWISAVNRVLKPSGSMFVFSGYNNLKDILIAADECNLQTVNHIIWKYQFGVVTKRKFVTSHYHVLYYCKDNSQRQFFQNCRFEGEEKAANGGSLRYKDMEDVWDIPREYWTGKVKTPTKLPAEIIRKILSYASQPGDLVLDPFLGSGQTAVVSKLTGRDYLGFEIVKEYYEFVVERLSSDNYLIEPPSSESHREQLAMEIL